MQAIDIGEIERRVQRRNAEQGKNDFHHLAAVYRSRVFNQLYEKQKKISTVVEYMDIYDCSQGLSIRKE